MNVDSNNLKFVKAQPGPCMSDKKCVSLTLKGNVTNMIRIMIHQVFQTCLFHVEIIIFLFVY